MDSNKKSWQAPSVEVYGDMSALTQTLKVCGDADGGILIVQGQNSPCGSSVLM